MPSYSPIDQSLLTVGLLANSDTWRTMTTNQRALYEDYAPTMASGALYAYTASATDETCTEWIMPRNADNVPVRVSVLWRVGAPATGTATLEVTDGSSSDSASITTTSTSFAWADIDVTPSSSSGHPRTCRLKLKTSADTVYVIGLLSYLTPAAPGAGTLASGYARTGAELYASGAPVSSERVDRLIGGPIAVATDRPAVVVSILDDFQASSARAMMTTDKAAAIVAKWVTPPTGGTSKEYIRVSVYLDTDATAAPTAHVTVNGYPFTFSGTGWQHATGAISAPDMFLDSCVLGVSSGSGNVFLRALVIMRGN